MSSKFCGQKKSIVNNMVIHKALSDQITFCWLVQLIWMTNLNLLRNVTRNSWSCGLLLKWLGFACENLSNNYKCDHIFFEALMLYISHIVVFCVMYYVHGVFILVIATLDFANTSLFLIFVRENLQRGWCPGGLAGP